MSPDERASRSAEMLWARDSASKWLGFSLTQVSQGSATLEMIVAPHHCNGHGTCHGGVIFALADSAFAFACNSRNQNTVAQHNVITYIASPGCGVRLTARAEEVSLQGRNGIYDVKVSDERGTPVAEFRGFSRTIAGAIFDEEISEK